MLQKVLRFANYAVAVLVLLQILLQLHNPPNAAAEHPVTLKREPLDERV